MRDIYCPVLNLLVFGRTSIKGNPCEFQTTVSIIFGDDSPFVELHLLD
jgi:hypothetical protein